MASYGAPGRMPAGGYPPEMNDMYPTVNSTSTLETKVGEDHRQISRTPSPTPSELKELKTGAIDWKTLKNWRFWIRREWLWYYVILVVIVTITVLVSVFHKQIVHWLTPVSRWLFDLKFGWLVPIGVLFVISFPPLFGHEIVAILCGLVWGLWVGFGIVAAGTFLGEVGNFYAFKYCCRSRGEKLERTKITYACLARVVRDGGFKIALIARLSAIPGHFTTAVFSTCGMGIFVFSLAAILSMPKQFITVYLGVILEQSDSGVKDTKSRIISNMVLAITFIITIAAMWYILREMNSVKPQVIYDRRKARQAKLSRAGFSPYANGGPSSSSTDVFNPHASDSDIPLTNKGEATYQQWDRQGKAVGFVPDPRTNFIFTPKPRVTNAAFLPPARDVEEAGATRPLAHGREDSVDVVGWETAPPVTREFGSKGMPISAPLPNRQHSSFVSGAPAQVSSYETHVAPRSPFDEAYDDPYQSSHGHMHEPTDATFRTAFTSSPIEADDHDLRRHIPHYGQQTPTQRQSPDLR